MNLKLIGNNIVETPEGKQFVIGLRWLDPVVGGTKFSRKVKLSQKLAEAQVNTGVEFHTGDDSVQAGGDPQEEYKGKLSLAVLVASGIEDSTIAFARVEDDTYWVCCIKSDGTIEMTSDRVLNSYDLTDYITERLNLDGTEINTRVINFGTAFEFDDFEINDKLEHVDNLFNLDPKGAERKNASIVKLSTKFNQMLIGGVVSALSLVTVGGYLYITTELPEMTAIARGDYSQTFNGQYSRMSRQLTAIESSGRALAMDKDSFIRESQKQYNEFILSYPTDDLNPFYVLLQMKDNLPLHQNGWVKSRTAYTDGKYYVSYERVGDYPSSSNFKELDKSLIQYDLGEGSELRPLRTLSDGNVRLYEYYIPIELSDEYLEFAQKEREIEDQRASVVAQVREKKRELDSIRSAISDSQNSVYSLNLLDKKDSLIAGNIIREITSQVERSKQPVEEMLDLIEGFEAIEELEVPLHTNTLLSENGIEDELVPLLQILPMLETSSPAQIDGLPQGVTDSFYSSQEYITKSEIDVSMELSLRDIAYAEPLLKLEYVFLGEIIVDISRTGKESVDFKIFLHELNRDYAF
ncbi:hypothetical protein VCHA53O466_40395 [Vibrio chagasii]|nr:hypothetical protein VCHA53O466_40395 [Vibrio chagasii]